MINTVVIEGRIVSEVELRETVKRQIPVVNFRIMNAMPGESSPLFVKVEVWDISAERVAANCKRDDQVVVYGKLQLDSWEGRDGKKRVQAKIKADRVVPVTAFKPKGSLLED